MAKFREGDHVRLVGGFRYRAAADGAYEIVRKLPVADGAVQYRIKSGQEQYERVVSESEIERAAPAA
ncbi:hypothetical protein A33M_0521 [Rhodovulum sp. PH10]|nr:hypothetical protein A33M_0521 [Rhodovulum sp. PH10]